MARRPLSDLAEQPPV